MAHRGKMNSSGNRNMGTSDTRLPHRITDSFATECDQYKVQRVKKLRWAYLDVVRVARKASNMADRARSKTCNCRFDPPPALGSNSFSPRFGITGRTASGLCDLKRQSIAPCVLAKSHISFVQSSPPSSSSDDCSSSSSCTASARDTFGAIAFGSSNVSSICSNCRLFNSRDAVVENNENYVSKT